MLVYFLGGGQSSENINTISQVYQLICWASLFSGLENPTCDVVGVWMQLCPPFWWVVIKEKEPPIYPSTRPGERPGFELISAGRARGRGVGGRGGPCRGGQDPRAGGTSVCSGTPEKGS